MWLWTLDCLSLHVSSVLSLTEQTRGMVPVFTVKKRMSHNRGTVELLFTPAALLIGSWTPSQSVLGIVRTVPCHQSCFHRWKFCWLHQWKAWFSAYIVWSHILRGQLRWIWIRMSQHIQLLERALIVLRKVFLEIFQGYVKYMKWWSMVVLTSNFL